MMPHLHSSDVSDPSELKSALAKQHDLPSSDVSDPSELKSALAKPHDLPSFDVSDPSELKSALAKQHEAITGRIIRAAMAVSNELGSGFLESVYQNVFLIAMSDEGLSVTPQLRMNGLFRSRNVGDFIADFLVESRVVVEIKAVQSLGNEHLAQVINYLRASGHPLALLINFGRPKLEFKRILNPMYQIHPSGISKSDGDAT